MLHCEHNVTRELDPRICAEATDRPQAVVLSGLEELRGLAPQIASLDAIYPVNCAILGGSPRRQVRLPSRQRGQSDAERCAARQVGAPFTIQVALRVADEGR